MTNEVIISIVLPVYNGETYLEDAILSIVKQTYKNFELIIVDDCSTDQSSTIAQRFVGQFNNIHYLKNEYNLKLPSSLNRGFSLARGKYWTWTSCDNVYLPNALERLVTVLESDMEIGLVYSDMQIIDEVNAKHQVIVAENSQDLILRNVVGASFLYRADMAKKIGAYNPEMFLCEDYEYWLRFGTVAKLKELNEILYLYRVHNNSLSETRKKEVISKGIKLQKQYYRRYINTRTKAARFYAYMRERDVYNPFRNLFLLLAFYYSPVVFLNTIYNIIKRRASQYA